VVAGAGVAAGETTTSTSTSTTTLIATPTLMVAIACRINQPAAEIQATSGSTIRNTAEELRIRIARLQRSMAERPAAIPCLRDGKMRVKARPKAETGNSRESVTAVLREGDKNKRLLATVVRPGTGHNRESVTAARVAEIPVTGVPGQPTEVRIVVAVVEIESAIVAFRAAPDLATRVLLAEALAEAVRALAVAGARPAWARAVAAVDEGGSHHEEKTFNIV